MESEEKKGERGAVEMLEESEGFTSLIEGIRAGGRAGGRTRARTLSGDHNGFRRCPRMTSCEQACGKLRSRLRLLEVETFPSAYI